MRWLDPDSVPTLGDWFRAGGYKTHYRGKWHISHADLVVPGTHDSLMASDVNGERHPRRRRGLPQGRPARPVRLLRVDRPRTPRCLEGRLRQRAGRSLRRAGGRPVRRARAGATRRPVARGRLVRQSPRHRVQRDVVGADSPRFSPPDGSVPDIPAAPSQADSFAGRPPCQEQFKAVWPKVTYEQSADIAYRRLYYYLHQVVDEAIDRILKALHDAGLADDTIVVLTSDHGDLVGAHGGMMQKWYNAYEEAIHVPLVVAGPGDRCGRTRRRRLAAVLHDRRRHLPRTNAEQRAVRRALRRGRVPLPH